jgi:amino acid transporter
MTNGPRLARRLGTTEAAVIGLGSMIGAGVFAAFAPAAAATGLSWASGSPPSSPARWVIAYAHQHRLRGAEGAQALPHQLECRRRQ